MKDHIDKGFIRLFKAKYLFKDYEDCGTLFPMENDMLFEEED